jgi:hypothetical protein
MDAYATAADTAERVWLARTCDALWHTRAACHIVHYEDWFSRPQEVAEGLARQTGLDPAGAAACVGSIVRPDLDRSGRADYILQHPGARALHAALDTCRGSAFDRERLLQTVAACCGSLDASPA